MLGEPDRFACEEPEKDLAAKIAGSRSCRVTRRLSDLGQRFVCSAVVEGGCSDVVIEACWSSTNTLWVISSRVGKSWSNFGMTRFFAGPALEIDLPISDKAFSSVRNEFSFRHNLCRSSYLRASHAVSRMRVTSLCEAFGMNEIYENPLTSRYAGRRMARLWSAQTKFTTWRRLWVALAEAERALGLNITEEQIAALRARSRQSILLRPMPTSDVFATT